MAANHQNSYILNASIETLRAVILDSNFASTLNLELKSENLTMDGVWYRFHHGMTFTSWGEKITITLTRIDNMSTSLTILSECGMPTQVIDWGKNRQNVCNIFEYIDKVFPAFSFATPTYSETINFCNRCGAKVTPDSVFCTNCGNKLR